jgi:hypothetical protein
MTKRVDSKTIDAITVKTGASDNGIQVSIPDQPALQGFLKLLSLNDLDLIVEGVRAHTGFGTNYIDVDYLKTDVEVSNPVATLLIEVAAFDRLMARVLSVAMANAKKTAKPATKQAWWAKAEESLKEIVKRAYPAGLT